MEENIVPPLGLYGVRVDEKGRLKLPTDLVRFLGEGASCFVTSFDEKTVRIYPAKEWERVQKGLDGEEGEPLWFVANELGGEAELDAQGRLLVPPELRRKTQMENTPVRLRWRRDHIEVVNES